MEEPKGQAANGFKNVSVAGSNNIAPVMHETLGIIFLGIISLVLLCEVRRLSDLNRKQAGKKCECKCCQGEGCCCECCKGEKCSCDCCKGEKCACDCGHNEKEEAGEQENAGS
jgi:hypothetical protein